VLGGDSYGLTVRDVTRRGAFTVARLTREGGGEDGKEAFVRQIAFNGPSEESEVGVLTRRELTERMGGAAFKWIGEGDAISLQGARVHGEQLWKWLIWSALLLFVVERVVVAWPVLTAVALKERGTR
jgi:hypothetical protein